MVRSEHTLKFRRYHLFLLALMLLTFASCQLRADRSVKPDMEWMQRPSASLKPGLLTNGKTYLAVNPSIYDQSNTGLINLTTTVSLRNLDPEREVQLNSIQLYDTGGNLVKAYIDSPILMKPLETLQLIIVHEDNTGGTGAHFIFDWSTQPLGAEPQFDAVMISTYGQGISFQFAGVRIK